MIYLIMTCNPYRKFLLEGPTDFPIEEKFKEFKEEIEKEIGQEPNILCFGEHNNWVIRRINKLIELRNQYKMVGEFEDIFIRILELTFGFKNLEYKAIYL